MKLKTLLLTTALVTSTALNAFADAGAPAAKHQHKTKMEGYYGVAEVGATFPLKFKTDILGKLKYKSTNFIGGVGVGYEVNEFFRSDVRVQYRDFGAKKNPNTGINNVFGVTGSYAKIKSNAWTAMLNGYVDAHNDTMLTPYVMAGIGAGYMQSKLTVTLPGVASQTQKSKNKWDFAWNAGLGVMAKATDQLSFDLAYRFVGFSKVGKTKKFNVAGIGIPVKMKALYTNDITIGAIWHF